MKRRQLLTIGMLGAGATLLIPKLAFSQETQNPAPIKEEEVLLSSDIGNNHGHELVLSTVAVLKLLRQTKSGEVISLNIQGRSGHPHELQLAHEDLLVLILDGQVSRDSTLVAGHTHSIQIRMEIAVPALQEQPA